MIRNYEAVTCRKAMERTGGAPRHYGYTILIQPPIEPDGDRPVAENERTKRCDNCSAETPMSRLHDITTCGDWMTVCGACRDNLLGKPKPQSWQGWYKHKADAESRAAELNKA